MTNQTELLERSINLLNKYGENDSFIAEIKEALAEQPTQEPYAWVMVNRNPDHQDIYFLPTKPTREQKISHQP